MTDTPREVQAKLDKLLAFYAGMIFGWITLGIMLIVAGGPK